jgi:hypothetical protein
MADYYPLLAKAIAGLTDSTAEARHAIYERARRALFGQLRNLDPPVPEEAIEREAQALERAVAQLETELTSRSGPGSGAVSAEPDLAGSGPPAAAPPAREPSTAPLPRSASPDSEPPGLVPSAKLKLPFARTPRSVPPLKVRRDPPGVSAGDRPNGTPQSGTASPSAERDETQVPAAGFVSYGDTASSETATDPIAAEASSLEAPVLNAPAFETFAAEAPSTSYESYEPAVRTRLEAQRPFAPGPEVDSGAAKRVAIVAAIAGLVVVLVAIAAYKLRDRPEDLVRLQPPSPAIQGEANTGGKIVDRIGAGTATPGAPEASAGGPSTITDRNDAAKGSSGPANPPVPVARRAALLVEAPEEPSKVKTSLGTVVWRVDNVSNGPDEPLSMAVRADVDIADEGLQAEMIIQKNFDSTLPASHTMKLQFTARPGSPLANIKQISLLQMRREDTPTGEPLKGITVPVTGNSFLIGLSRGDAETPNLDLLHSREWFDIPMVLANGHIAKLTFEKGPSGRSAIDDAMASWQARQ